MLHVKAPNAMTEARSIMHTEEVFVFNNKVYNIRRTIIKNKEQTLKRTARMYNWPHDPVTVTTNISINDEHTDNNYKAPSCIFSFDEELNSKA